MALAAGIPHLWEASWARCGGSVRGIEETAACKGILKACKASACVPLPAQQQQQLSVHAVPMCRRCSTANTHPLVTLVGHHVQNSHFKSSLHSVAHSSSLAACGRAANGCWPFGLASLRPAALRGFKSP